MTPYDHRQAERVRRLNDILTTLRHMQTPPAHGWRSTDTLWALAVGASIGLTLALLA